MSGVVIRDMQSEDEYFVGTCTHTDESDELDRYAERRVSWLRDKYKDGLRVKVALVNGVRKGFLHVMPIEISPVEPIGEDLLSILCLTVSYRRVLDGLTGSGIGRALIDAAEKEARAQSKKGIVTVGYYTDFWFMPAGFFKKCGFSVVERRGERAIMWKVFADSPERPVFFQPSFRSESVSDKIVLDIFWMTFCGAMDRDIVLEVAREFGDSVVVREHCVDDRKILLDYQMNRAFLVNGSKAEWDFENQKDCVRAAIAKARDELGQSREGV